MSNNIGILASGRGSNFSAILDNIKSGRLNATIRLLIVDNENAGALLIARREHVKHKVILRGDYTSKVDFEKTLIIELEKEGVELVVLAGFMRILSPFFIKTFLRRIINIHPALLPAFPGLDAQKQALNYGVKYTGCTVHFVDEGVDTGSIILQRVVPVLDNDSVESLSARILKEEHLIYSEAIKLFFEKRLAIVDRCVKIIDSHLRR